MPELGQASRLKAGKVEKMIRQGALMLGGLILASVMVVTGGKIFMQNREIRMAEKAAEELRISLEKMNADIERNIKTSSRPLQVKAVNKSPKGEKWKNLPTVNMVNNETAIDSKKKKNCVYSEVKKVCL